MIDIGKETLLSLQEAAKVLKCSYSGVVYFVRQGRLESIKIGGLRRTSVEALQRFAQRTKQGYGMDNTDVPDRQR